MSENEYYVIGDHIIAHDELAQVGVITHSGAILRLDGRTIQLPTEEGASRALDAIAQVLDAKNLLTPQPSQRPPQGYHDTINAVALSNAARHADQEVRAAMREICSHPSTGHPREAARAAYQRDFATARALRDARQMADEQQPSQRPHQGDNDTKAEIVTEMTRISGMDQTECARILGDHAAEEYPQDPREAARIVLTTAADEAEGDA